MSGVLATVGKSGALGKCLRRLSKKCRGRGQAELDVETVLTHHDGDGTLASVPEDVELCQEEEGQYMCAPCDCTFCQGSKGIPFVNELPNTVSREVYAACLDIISTSSRVANKSGSGACRRVVVVGDVSRIREVNIAQGSGTPDDRENLVLNVLERSNHSELCRGFIEEGDLCTVEGLSGSPFVFSRLCSNSQRDVDMSSHIDERSKWGRALAERCDCMVMLSSKDSVIILRGRRGDVHRHNYKPMRRQVAVEQKKCLVM